MKTTAGMMRITGLGMLAALLLANGACVTEDTFDTQASEAISSQQAAVSSPPPVTPTMTWLASLPAVPDGELALGRLFAQGTATYVPTGVGTGYPVLFSSLPELNWLASQLWGGKTLRVISSATHPNGDPIVRLDNKIIKTPAGAVLDLFDAYVTRGPVGQVEVGVNDRGQVVPPPSGTLDPVHLSFLNESVVIDTNPSIVLNYFDDRSLPVIRRVFDEIREIDGGRCKGLYLGRAHVRRCTSLYCGELASPLVDFPHHPTFDTRYQWAFWTYFLLDFGRADGSTCDLTEVFDAVEQQLREEGRDIDLPAPPPAS